MKLSEMFVVGLMIFLINTPMNGQGIKFSSSGASVSSMVQYALKVFTFVLDVINPDKTQENVVEILGKVGEISDQLDTFDTRMDLKLHSMLETLFVAIKVSPNLQYSKAKLCEYINEIDHYFDRARELKYGGAFSNKTLERFGSTALWCGNNLPDILRKLNDLFIPNANKPGFLSLMHQHNMIKRSQDCNTGQSAQQQMYYTFVQLFIAEVKGLITLGEIFMLHRLFDESSHNYIPEMKIMKTNFEKRMRTYHEIFSRELALFPRDLRRCEVHSPVRGQHFLEFEKYSHPVLYDSFNPATYKCAACEYFDTSPMHTINNCIQITGSLALCPAELGSGREFEWLRDRDGVYYGPNSVCAEEKLIKKLNVRGLDWILEIVERTVICPTCVCDVEWMPIPDDFDGDRIWRISVTEQISNHRDNMVVTGVKFVIRDRTLHLQIQQNRIHDFGLSYDESSWKELDSRYDNQGMEQRGTQLIYKPLHYKRKTLHLDDILAPEGHVVTGVRFQVVDDSAFELEIHATPYDFATGILSSSESAWFPAGDYPVDYRDYDRKRVEIDMGNSDLPTRGYGFTYDSQSNKKVKFTHTDLHKDAGQTTIPLFDAQSIETQPPMPLNGIGLSFRGKNGFAGYVAPRIYTIDVVEYMASFNFTQLIPQETN